MAVDRATRACRCTFASELAVVVALFVYTAVLNASASPRVVPFRERDPALSFAYVPSTVSPSLLAWLAVALPLALIIVGVGVRRFVLDHAGARATALLACWMLLAFAQAIALCLATTDSLKLAFGRPRPVFFSYCSYAEGLARPALAADATPDAVAAYLAATDANALGDVRRCATPTDDARKSFPSGHSSLSFAGLTCLVLAQRHLARVRAGEYASARALASAWPLALACWIAATRTWDRMHGYDDVFAGAVIGAACAAAAWRHFVTATPSRDPEHGGDDDDDGEDSEVAGLHADPKRSLRVAGGAGERWLPAGVPESAPAPPTRVVVLAA